jgi:hypothetical protein
MSDLMVHIDESLPVEELSRIETHLAGQDGIASVTMQDKTPHLMVVEYNEKLTDSQRIIQMVRDMGVHAELVGM